MAVDTLGGGALFVELLVLWAAAVELVTNAIADAGGQGGDATTLEPVGMLNRAGAPVLVLELEQRADKATILVWDCLLYTSRCV